MTGAKLKNGAVNGAKVADGSLTGADLAPGTIPAPTPPTPATPPAVAFTKKSPDKVKLAAGESVVGSVGLPAGLYVVHAQAEIAGSSAEEQFLPCRLTDDGVTVGGVTVLVPKLAVYSTSAEVTGTSDGGTVALVCEPGATSETRNREFTAIKVQAVTPLP